MLNKVFFFSWKWICLGVFIKLIMAAFLIYYSAHNYGYSNGTGQSGIYYEVVDTPSYILPIENLLKIGSYTDDISNKWAGVVRMPGYGAIYLLFRLFFLAPTAKSLLVILQIIAGGISVYCLSFIAFEVLKKKAVFYITFFLYAFSSFVSLYDYYIVPESLAVSCLIFSLYYLFKYKNSNKSIHVFLSGFFFTLTVSLRPHASVLILFFIAYILYCGKPWKHLKPLIINILIFVSSITVFDGLWVVRNYNLLNRIIPFQYNSWIHTTGSAQADFKFYAFRWISAVGQDVIYYRPNTLCAWLHNNQFIDKNLKPPEYIYTSQYNYDSLLIVRQDFLRIMGSSEKTDTFFIDRFNKKMDFYYKSYVKEQPFQYLFLNRLRLFKSFLVHSGSPYLPFKKVDTIKNNLIPLVFKIISSLIYWIVLLMSIPGLYFFYVSKNKESILMLLSALYLTLLFPIVLMFIDIRFFNLAYPILVISSVCGIVWVREKFQLSFK